MAKNEHQKLIMEILGTKPIAFNPDLAKVLGSAKAGLFLSQLLYWHKKGHDKDWVYKTIKEMEEETALSRAEQDSAIKICKNLGLIKTIRKGIPARRHFWVNIPGIINLLELSLQKTNKPDWGKETKSVVNNLQTNTENTTDNTNKNHFFYKRNKTKIYKKIPYFRNMKMVKKNGKWFCINNGEWFEFAGKESEIKWE
jgi:DNA-binding transcriptional regulator GbsR (MarR family)